MRTVPTLLCAQSAKNECKWLITSLTHPCVGRRSYIEEGERRKERRKEEGERGGREEGGRRGGREEEIEEGGRRGGRAYVHAAVLPKHARFSGIGFEFLSFRVLVF